MASKTTYATVTLPSGKTLKLAAAQDTSGASTDVCVWIANGRQLGWYRLDRFEGGRLTPATLRTLFEG